MPVITDPFAVDGKRGTVYPKEMATGFEKRLKRPLTGPLGLTQFGVNLTTLEPGAQSAHRHWHRLEDEFIYVLDGELTLVTNAGETILRSGMAAGFPANDGDGHHLVNRSLNDAHYLEIGSRNKDEDATYPDVDLRGEKREGVFSFFHKDGRPY